MQEPARGPLGKRKLRDEIAGQVVIEIGKTHGLFMDRLGLVLCFVSNCHKYQPFVVSLSNHEWLHKPAFDKLRPNGLYKLVCETQL